jgi:hypothetical protein
MPPFPRVVMTRAITDRMTQLDLDLATQLAILNGEIALPPELAGGPSMAPDNYDGEGFYTDGTLPGFGAGIALLPASPAAPAVVAGTVTVTLAMLSRALGSSILGRQAYNLLRGVVARGGNIWTGIPSWIRTALLFLGLDTGVPFIMGALDEDMEPASPTALVPQLAPGTGIVLEGGLPVGVIGKWEANGVWFYRLADGRLAVQNLKGRWKVWRPKKPIVIYSSGVGDLRTLLRADAAIDRQAKKLDKMLNRRTRRSTRSSACVSCGLVRGHRSGCPVSVTIK